MERKGKERKGKERKGEQIIFSPVKTIQLRRTGAFYPL